MYLFVFEDGVIKKATTFDDGDKMMCDDGIVDVIDLHEENPKQWYHGEWHELESADL